MRVVKRQLRKGIRANNSWCYTLDPSNQPPTTNLSEVGSDGQLVRRGVRFLRFLRRAPPVHLSLLAAPNEQQEEESEGARVVVNKQKNQTKERKGLKGKRRSSRRRLHAQAKGAGGKPLLSKTKDEHREP